MLPAMPGQGKSGGRRKGAATAPKKRKGRKRAAAAEAAAEDAPAALPLDKVLLGECIETTPCGSHPSWRTNGGSSMPG